MAPDEARKIPPEIVELFREFFLNTRIWKIFFNTSSKIISSKNCAKMAQAVRLNLRMQKELKLLLTDPPLVASFPVLSDSAPSLSSSSSSFSLSSIDAPLSQRNWNSIYILLVYEAGEFSNLVINETLMDHVSSVQSRYPSYTICYVTNRLMSYIYKREQEQYKNPTSSNGWRHPLVEESEATKEEIDALRATIKCCRSQT